MSTFPEKRLRRLFHCGKFAETRDANGLQSINHNKRTVKFMDVQALINALKTAYPQSGLSDKEIAGIANGLYATGLVTDENVKDIVAKQNDSIKGFQSLFDSRFNAQKEAFAKALSEQNQKSFMEKYRIDKDGKQKPLDPPAPQTEDEKLLAKVAAMLDEKIKPLSDKFTAEENICKQNERTAQIIDMAKKHGIKEEVAKMLNVPGDVADMDSYMKDMAQKLTNLGFPSATPPAGGRGNGDDDGKAIAAVIKAGASKK